MATYYVRTDGSNANTGTGPATNQAWQTLTYALANAALPDATNIIYVAPGTYRETPTMTITPSAGATLKITGDTTVSQFSGLSPGIVRLTSFLLDDTIPSTGQTFTSAKGYWTLENFYIDGYQPSTNFTTGIVYCSDADNITIQNCCVSSHAQTTGTCISLVRTTASAFNCTVKNCILLSDQTMIVQSPTTGSPFSTNINVSDCVFLFGGVGVIGPSAANGVGNGLTFANCLFVTGRVLTGLVVNAVSGATAFPTIVTNCNFIGFGNSGAMSASFNGLITQTYNRISTQSGLTNVASSATTKSGVNSIEFGHSRLFGLGGYQVFAPWQNSPAINAGNSTSAPLVDMFGTTWSTPSTPDVAPAIRAALSSITAYNPTERNASTITIAPGSTSQSIELYLGATGLTASTTGLSARYNRTRTASVSIPLVARTIAQAWTAGGFAEVDATNMPGVYRLDVPDAALAAGADDVTIVVRGASGTNGAVMTVKLSSGGLTSAQTAAAVWDAAYTSHTAANSFGARSLLTTVDNRPVVVGTSNHIHANVHAIVDSTIAADELSGALLHNGTDYISAELLSPVSAATSVHIGPYQLLADGLGADQPLDVNVGTATSIDVQVTDANGTGIDITGATVSAKVYNSGGTLVATYAGTATYADNGRLSFGLTTTVTNTSGTYTVTVTRTTGATDTQIFGPLRLYVRPV
jgi:hypothetical protein